jgi:hypothetical protein
LVPIVVDDGKSRGDLVLSLDLDADGKVSQTRLVSGPDNLYRAADKLARLFNHKQFGGQSGAVQDVHFWKTADGIHRTRPVYPPIAKMAHVTGTVELVATVAADGHVAQSSVLSGPQMLIGSAKDAVSQWVYPPVTSNGVPCAFYAIIDVNYATY